MTDPSSDTSQPVVATQPGEMVLSDAEIRLLTEARTASWRVEQYEHEYDMTVRALTFRQTVLDYLAVLIALIFLFLHFAVPDKNKEMQAVLGIVGTGLSLSVILATIWASMAQWKARIEKMRTLSSEARELLKSHERLAAKRPVVEEELRGWIIDCLSFDDHRKEPVATVSSLCSKRAFQHVGNRHVGRGVVCGICNKEWTHESNKRARWSWIPFFGCSGCGV